MWNVRGSAALATEEKFSGFEGKYWIWTAPGAERLHEHPQVVAEPDANAASRWETAVRAPFPCGEYELPHRHRALGCSPQRRLRGSAILRQDVLDYRQAYIDAGHVV